MPLNQMAAVESSAALRCVDLRKSRFLVGSANGSEGTSLVGLAGLRPNFMTVCSK
jgi:hypothetical protein